MRRHRVTTLSNPKKNLTPYPCGSCAADLPTPIPTPNPAVEDPYPPTKKLEPSADYLHLPSTPSS